MAESNQKKIDFFQLKATEKIGHICEYAVEEKRYAPLQFASLFFSSETFFNYIDWDVATVSQAKTYVLHLFEDELGTPIQTQDDAPLYAPDMYWLGYLIAYWCFCDETTGKEIVKEYDLVQIFDDFEMLHTQSIHYAIDYCKENYKRVR